MKNRKLLVLLAIVLVVSTVLIGSCGGEEETPTTQTTTTQTTTTQTTQTTTTQTTTTPVAGQPKYGGTMRYLILSQPAGYDAHRKISYSPVFSLPIFSTLVYLDPTKDTLSPENIIGDLAERWEISPDGTTYTFYLHQGVKWHDGQPFTADDVVYSIEKMMDPTMSAVASTFATMKQLEKVDDNTVRITLDGPSPFFLVALSSAYCPIQAKHLANVDYKSTDFLVGTGPFMFQQLDAGVSLELVRNPDYFKEGLPYLDSVIVYFMADRTAQLNALISGRADLAFSNLTNQDLVDQFNAQKGPDITLTMSGADFGAAYFFNVDSEPLNNKNVRNALMLLYDQAQNVIASYGDVKWANLDHAWFPRPYGLPKEEIAQITGWDEPYERRILDAQQLMRDAGYYPTGFKLKIIMSPMVELQRGILWWADQLQRYLNIQVETKLVGYADLYGIKMAGDFDVFPDMIYCLLLDPNEFAPVFQSGSPANFIHYSNSEVDTLFDQQAGEMDLTKRIQIAQQIERLLLDDAVSIPLPWNLYGVIDRPYVKGFVRTNTSYTSELKWETVWLDK